MGENATRVNLTAPVRDLWADEPGARSRAASRAMSRLRHAGIWTVGELTARTAGDITDIRLAGPETVTEIRRVLARAGLALKDDDPTAAAREHARFRVLRGAGIGPAAARRFARELWPAGEIAPGVTLTVTEAAAHV